MMRYLYFDLIGGISGDMIVASLLDITGDFNYLRNELKKINLGEYKLRYSRCQSGHIKAHRFIVEDLAKGKRVFQFNAIKNKIRNSHLSPETKKKILDIYENLYEAERKVHGSGHVHFQQIGEIDSLIDIASSCILIDKMRLEQILYSCIPFGRNIAPATTLMLKSRSIYLSNLQYENITPTGIAVIATLGTQVQQNLQYDFTFEKAGYGAGSIKIDKTLNILRVMLFKQNKKAVFKKDEIVVIQCNIDDMSPQILGFLMDKLYKAGALEVYFENFYSKKSRLGILISVLSKYETFDTISDIIFRETTTLGIRYFKANRIKLERKARFLKTSLGKVRLKEVVDKGYKKIIPEYDDCVKIAKSKNIPLKDVFEKINL
ncbi:MAG: LarC family nickel insertion protein [Candidatus Omnitrophica bacterium]|nr:LarC family nickel insertion protein [Candidatus Omnitrophota bacterium]